MTRQRRALPAILGRVAEVDGYAGVVLQGSVARSAEREDSDIDVTVIVSREPTSENELLNAGNRGRMTLVRLGDIKIDINWESRDALLRLFAERGAWDWYPFSRGELLCDPRGLAADCQRAALSYFAANPRIAAEWVEQHERLTKHKVDPTYALQYPTWPDFSRYLAMLSRGG